MDSQKCEFVYNKSLANRASTGYKGALMDVPGVSDIKCMTMLCRCVLLFASASAFAADLNTIGVMTLWNFEPALNGATIRVAQAEASEGPGAWEVNPAAVGLPVSTFTWISGGGTATSFPNALGSESWHGDEVGRHFYGASTGPAPGVLHVDNYEAGYFLNFIVPNQTAIAAKIVSQSFVLGAEESTSDRNYDRYAARYNVLFVSGAGNGGAPQSPSTAYNGISVAAFGGLTSVGPTLSGRCKPDITAPAGYTSFSTPQVAGAATILHQAAARGDGGNGTATDLSDIRAVKALLLNGAQKPPGWTNSASGPLDLRHGAGVLNVFQSYRQLRAGRQSVALSQSIGLGNPHLPPPATNEITSRRGWDFATATSTLTNDGVQHYFFNVLGPSNRTFTATLVWNRQQNQTAINDLDLFLYRVPENTLVANSVSLVDNVEHVCVTNLAPGHYNLQVFKSGGPLKRVTNNETYALAFDFGPSRPAVFQAPVLAGGQFTTRLVGEPNQRYVVQVAAAPPNWAPFATNMTSSVGTMDISLAPTANCVLRVLELP
jgi:Subtilase family